MLRAFQSYAIGVAVPSGKDIFGLNDDTDVVVGVAEISFTGTTDGDGPEKNRVKSFAEILTEELYDAIDEDSAFAIGVISFNSLKAFEDSNAIIAITEIISQDFNKDAISQDVYSSTEITPDLSFDRQEESNVVGVGNGTAKDDFINPANASIVEGTANLFARDRLAGVNRQSAVGVTQANPSTIGVITIDEYKIAAFKGAFDDGRSDIEAVLGLGTVDLYYGLTSTDNPFPPPFIANPPYGLNGDGIAIGRTIIKYNRDNFVSSEGVGSAQSFESIGTTDDGVIVTVARMEAEDLFPTYGTVTGHARIRDISEITILNKPSQAYSVVITGAIGDGTQIIYNAINDFQAGEEVTISRYRRSTPIDWWDLGQNVVIESSTGTTFTVLSSNTGSFNPLPQNDGYAIVTSSAYRYGSEGLQAFPSVYEDLKYGISAIEIYNYSAALAGVSAGSSLTGHNLTGDPFVLAGRIFNISPLNPGGVPRYKGSVALFSNLPTIGNAMEDFYYVEAEANFRIWNGSAWLAPSDVKGEMTVFVATSTSGYAGAGSPPGVYGTGAYS